MVTSSVPSKLTRGEAEYIYFSLPLRYEMLCEQSFSFFGQLLCGLFLKMMACLSNNRGSVHNLMAEDA